MRRRKGFKKVHITTLACAELTPCTPLPRFGGTFSMWSFALFRLTVEELWPVNKPNLEPLQIIKTAQHPEIFCTQPTTSQQHLQGGLLVLHGVKWSINGLTKDDLGWFHPTYRSHFTPVIAGSGAHPCDVQCDVRENFFPFPLNLIFDPRFGGRIGGRIVRKVRGCWYMCIKCTAYVHEYMYVYMCMKMYVNMHMKMYVYTLDGPRLQDANRGKWRFSL